MPTPLYILDDEFKSVTITPQNPERAVHVLKCLIEDGTVIPRGFDKAYFDYPYDLAPLVIKSSDSTLKYTRINLVAGLVANHTYVTFFDKIGADVIFNSRCTFEALDLLGFKYNDKVISILKNDAELCDKDGIYSAKLLSGKYFSYMKNGKEYRIDIG